VRAASCPKLGLDIMLSNQRKSYIKIYTLSILMVSVLHPNSLLPDNLRAIGWRYRNGRSAPVVIPPSTMETFTRPVPRSNNLARHTALITGASGGCGHAIAHYLGFHSQVSSLMQSLAGAGSNICLHYHSHEPTSLVKELAEYEISVHSIKADLSSTAECERLASEAVKWSPTGGIDILISNSGAGKRKNWIDVLR
jgi:short chain dehydrogenase